MPDWYLIPSLIGLRGEFNSLAPGRSKASDGSIGDQAHSASLSDHNPDNKGAVHAIDVTSAGPWPAGRSMRWAVDRIVGRHRDGADDRLQYVIYDREIASRSWGWTWRAYTGASPHTHHAHFSARYTHDAETGTRAWGLLGESATIPPKDDDMPLSAEDIDKIRTAVWGSPIQAPPGSAASTWTAPTFLANSYSAAVSGRTYAGEGRAFAQQGVALLQALAALVATEAAGDDRDVAALKTQLSQVAARIDTIPALTAEAVLEGLDAGAIADAIPAGIASAVAEELAMRLARSQGA